MKITKNLERIIAAVLVVANIIASTGFSVLAGSVGQMAYDASLNQKEIKNYYYLYQEEQYHYSEQVKYYADYDTEGDIGDELKEKVKAKVDEALSDGSNGNA